MKRIYLLRHAKAVNGGDISDHERSLSEQGVLQMQEVAERLIDSGDKIDITLCSTATRTQQTLELLLQNGVKTSNNKIIDSLYLASAIDILNHAQTLDDNINNALIIGHNPGLATLCQAFDNTKLGNPDKHSLLTFTPATLAVIEYDNNKWNELTPQTGKIIGCYS